MMTNRKRGPAFLGTVFAVSLACSLPTMAADHRDAPTIDDYSAIDINDVYMFRDPNDASKLVLALTTQAVADPLFQPSYHFQSNALYRFNFTTRQDARPTATIDFVFSEFENGPNCPAPATACQTFRAVFPKKIAIEGPVTEGTAGAIHLEPKITKVGDIQVFAGPREDPFFFDLVGFNRSISAAANRFTGVDAFLGKNVNAIVIKFPLELVFPAGTCTGTTSPVFSTPCGAWAVSYLGDLEQENGGGKPHKLLDLAARFDKFKEVFGRGPEHLRQVDRMGNPAVNTALIPGALKDSFNFGQPQDDPKEFAGVILNQILALDKAFGTCPPTATSAAQCNPNVPLLASVAVPDVLRFASSVPDGYPNGRRPSDRTTDILISLILQIPGFTDGTAVKPYCSVFPFLGPPLQLSGAAPFQIKRDACP